MYHPACVGLSSIPKGKWYCPVCQKKKSNERNDSEEEEEEDEYDEEVCGFEQWWRVEWTWWLLYRMWKEWRWGWSLYASLLSTYILANPFLHCSGCSASYHLKCTTLRRLPDHPKEWLCPSCKDIRNHRAMEMKQRKKTGSISSPWLKMDRRVQEAKQGRRKWAVRQYRVGQLL